jgi:MFS family permease
VFQPSFASFSNIFGRRPMILIALLFFCVGAIISAIANNFTYMLVGRSIQGVGGGGIISLSEVIITDLVPLRWRGQYFGILSAMWSVGSVTGPILGGGFAENVSWVSQYILTALLIKLTREYSDGFSISTFPSLASV